MALSVKLYRVVGKARIGAAFRLIWDGGGDARRKMSRVADEVKKFLSKKSLRIFPGFVQRSRIKHLDQITGGDDLLPYLSFLRQRKTTRDTLFEPRYVYNIFQTCNTFLRANGILLAGESLGQLDYEEKEVEPYKPRRKPCVVDSQVLAETLQEKSAPETPSTRCRRTR